MSLFVNTFDGGEKVRKKPCEEDQIEKLSEGEELLMKKKEFLKEKIDQELMFVKKNSRKNRRVALQALRRKWHKKHLKCIDCAVKAMGVAHEHIDMADKVKDLNKDIREEQDGPEDMPHTLDTSLSFGVEFDKDQLQAELERLEKNLAFWSPFEEDRTEETVLNPKVSFTASASHPAKTEEDEIEADLEYLRRWLNEES